MHPASICHSQVWNGSYSRRQKQRPLPPENPLVLLLNFTFCHRDRRGIWDFCRLPGDEGTGRKLTHKKLGGTALERRATRLKRLELRLRSGTCRSDENFRTQSFNHRIEVQTIGTVDEIHYREHRKRQTPSKMRCHRLDHGRHARANHVVRE
jgi:hypothetical protein